MNHQSFARVYGPLLAILLVQAMVIAVAPSKVPAENTEIAQGAGSRNPSRLDGGAGSQGDGLGVGEGDGRAISPESGEQDTQRQRPSGEDVGGTSADSNSGTGSNPGTEAAGASEDVSHCTESGRQFSTIYQSPPCAPKWPAGAENGGETYTGVTGDKIKLVFFNIELNEQVATVLEQTYGSSSQEDLKRVLDAFDTFVSSQYELSGRELETVFYQSECRITPPDEVCYREEAREISRRIEPFAVVFMNSLSQAFYEEIARHDIMVLGSINYSLNRYQRWSPYWWDWSMDGRRSGLFGAEYYCKKLADRNASHSGEVIHPSFPNAGIRGEVPRRLGFVVREESFYQDVPRVIKEKVQECSSEREPVVYTYEGDVGRLQEQSSAIISGLIEDEVTTVAFVGEGFSHAFVTREATRQGYFPEWWVVGVQHMDLAITARLADQEQWRHAFGMKHWPAWGGREEVDAARVWHAAGHEEHIPINPVTADYYWQRYSVLATGLHMAGARVTPRRIERALVEQEYSRRGWQESGGLSTAIGWQFGEGNYTALEDVAEIYWDRNRESPVDGESGHYVPLYDGQRFPAGQIRGQLDAPVEPS